MHAPSFFRCGAASAVWCTVFCTFAVLMALALSALGPASHAIASWVDLPLYLQPIRLRPCYDPFQGADMTFVEGGYYLLLQGGNRIPPGALGFALDVDGLATYPTPVLFSSRPGLEASQVGAAELDGDALIAWTSYNPGTGTNFIEACLQSHADWLSPSRPVVNLGAGMNPAVAGAGDKGLVVWSLDNQILATLVRASSWPTVPPPVTVASGTDIGARPAVAWSPEARVFLALYVSQFGSVLGRVVDENGNPAPMTVAIGNAASDARPSVSWDGVQFVVAWGSGGSVLARRVSSDGEPIDPDPIEVAAGMWPSEPRNASRAGETMIVWREGVGEPYVHYRVRAARLDADGTLLDPGGFVIYEASDWTDPYEARVESALWDGVRYRVTWLHGYLSCGGLMVPLHDVLSAAIIPSEPPIVEPPTLVSGFAEQLRVEAATLGDHLWTTWYATDRYGFEIVAARWAPTGQSLELRDPTGLSLARAESCYPVANGFSTAATAATSSTALTAWQHGHDDLYITYTTIMYRIHDVDGQQVASGELEWFPPGPYPYNWSGPPVVAASGDRFLVTYKGPDPVLEPIVYWKGIGGGGGLLAGGFVDLGTDELLQDATSNGSGYLLAWTVEGDSALVGRLDEDYTFVDPDGLYLAITSGGDDALRVASDGDAYLAVWDEAGSLRGARISAAGAILDPGGFAIADRPGSWPFDVDWDGNHYVLAWIDSDGDALIRVQRITASGEVVDPIPAEVLRRTDSLQWCSVTSRADGQSLIAATTYRRHPFTTGHGVLYWNPAIVAIGPGTTVTPIGSVRVLPNPFRIETALDLGELAGRAGELRIVDAHGRVVWHLMAPHGLASRVRWNGRSLEGHKAPAGVYFYEITSPGYAPMAGKIVRVP